MKKDKREGKRGGRGGEVSVCRRRRRFGESLSALSNIELSALSLSIYLSLLLLRSLSSSLTCELLKSVPEPPQSEAQSRKELGCDEGEQQQEATKMRRHRGGIVGHAAGSILLALLRTLPGPGHGLGRLFQKRRRPTGRRRRGLHRFRRRVGK